MPYRLAVTIAGAVSLGSFEAGVLFEVLDALAQHNRAAPPETCISLDVLTGASAGGMTAAIAAQTMLYSWPAVADPYDNPFYNAWVAGVDMKGLLPLAASESAGMSVFSSDFVEAVAERFLLGRYRQLPPPPPAPHPALNAAGTISLGLALSNLNGIDYQRQLLSGGAFNYTKFADQISFLLGAATDSPAAWTPITQAAVASGAFPLAFRPCDLSRNERDYATPFLTPWPQSPRNFTYTDGGVFQNQPLGLAKNLVDGIDQHQNSDTRSYLFISPKTLDSSVSPIAAKRAVFKTMTDALLNAIFNQAGFQDWIEAETVNDTVNLLNLRATQLAALLERGAIQAPSLESASLLLLPQFEAPAQLDAARAQLRQQFAGEYQPLASQAGTRTADAWIDAILLLELAADLHEKDEMYIYSVTADHRDLAGAGFFSFQGFLDRNFRDHDYDLGRQKAQAFLGDLHRISLNQLPQLRYTPKPIHPIPPTPPGGFTPAQIPPSIREELCGSLTGAVDTMLAQLGVGWMVRKGIEFLVVKRKIKKQLGCY
jgi:hypothetical protein